MREETSDEEIFALMRSAHKLRDRTSFDSLHAWILQNRHILEVDVWRMLEIHEDSRNSMAAADMYYYKEFHWRPTLVRLTVEGLLDKDRLLERCLASLERSDDEFRASWFSKLHDDLRPNQEQQSKLCEHYLNLLANPVSPTVNFALTHLLKIDKNQPLPSHLLKTHLPSCLTSVQKGTRMSALKLIERAAKRDSNFSLDACSMAMDSLAHQSLDVQEQAMSLLERFGDAADESLRSKISEELSAIAITISNRLHSWHAKGEPEGSSVLPLFHQIESVSYEFKQAPLDSWPLDCSGLLTPISDAGDLVERTFYCLEQPDNAIELELVLDGISRIPLGDDAALKARCAVLKSRAYKLFEKRGTDARKLLAEFLLKWLGTSHPLYLKTAEYGPPLLRIIRERLMEILGRTRRGVFLPLLSAPTHEGGWVDSKTFVERVRIWNIAKQALNDFDASVALLRVPRSHLKNLAKSNTLPDSLLDAVRYMSGVNDTISDTTTTLGRTASYAREPVDLKEPFHLNQHTTTEEPVLLGSSVFASHTDTLRWLAITAPSLRESIFAAGVRWAVQVMDHMLAADHNVKIYYELLTNSGAPLEKKALVLLTIGLTTSDPECCSYARDALIIAIDESRLNPKTLAVEVSAFLRSERSKQKRLANSLRDVSRIGPVHGDAVRQLLEYTLQGDLQTIPKDISAVLELLCEVCITYNTRVEAPETKEFLRALKRTGKSGAHIKQLLS